MNSAIYKHALMNSEMYASKRNKDQIYGNSEMQDVEKEYV